MSNNEEFLKKHNLPADSACAFDGRIFKVYTWPQKMYDGSVETFETVIRPDSVHVLATVGNKILITKQMQPHKAAAFYDTPGGRVEEGESLEEGAARELREETGYEAETITVWREYVAPTSVRMRIGLCIARNARKVCEPALDAGEQVESLFVTVDELLELVENFGFRNAMINADLLRIKLDPVKRAEFEKQLFQ